MKNLVLITALAAAMAAITSPAFASVTRVPEPMSLSLIAGGVAAIAAVRLARRK